MELYKAFIWMGAILVVLAVGAVIGTAVERALKQRAIIRKYNEATAMHNTRLDEYNDTVDRR